MIEVVNHWNKTYFNVAAPKIKVFKLDKDATVVDTLYGEERTSRIYIPPFEMRAFMLTNPWRQLLGLESYKEEEDNIQFIVNFEEMVKKIRDLKNSHLSEMYITYSGTGTPSVFKNGDSFVIKINGVVQEVYSITNTSFDTVRKLGTSINSVTNFSVRLIGVNDSSSNIVDFDETAFKAQTLKVYSQEAIYDNITDVVEAGDMILTNKWRLYEVLNTNPSGDFGWDWVTYTLSCNLARIDTAVLPYDYKQQISAHQYGVKEKINME